MFDGPLKLVTIVPVSFVLLLAPPCAEFSSAGYLRTDELIGESLPVYFRGKAGSQWGGKQGKTKENEYPAVAVLSELLKLNIGETNFFWSVARRADTITDSYSSRGAGFRNFPARL